MSMWGSSHVFLILLERDRNYILILSLYVLLQHDDSAFSHPDNKWLHLHQPINLVFKPPGPTSGPCISPPPQKLSCKQYPSVTFNCCCLCGSGFFSVESTASFLTRQVFLSAICRRGNSGDLPIDSIWMISPGPSKQMAAPLTGICLSCPAMILKL